MSLPEILALLVVFVAAPLSWLVAVLLWRDSLAEPGLRVLRAQAIAALGWAIVVTVFALIFANNGMDTPILGNVETQIITRGTLLAVSAFVALSWLRLYRKRSRH